MKTREEAARKWWKFFYNGMTGNTTNSGTLKEIPLVASQAFLAGIEWLESQASGKDFNDWWDLYKESWDNRTALLVECAWQAARLLAQKEIAEKDERIKSLESLYCASVEKNTFQLRVYEKQLQDAKDLVRELVMAVRFYGSEYNYDIDDYHGISGEMRYRCVLNKDMEERNDCYSFAGKKARTTLKQNADKIKSLLGEE